MSIYQKQIYSALHVTSHEDEIWAHRNISDNQRQMMDQSVINFTQIRGSQTARCAAAKLKMEQNILQSQRKLSNNKKRNKEKVKRLGEKKKKKIQINLLQAYLEEEDEAKVREHWSLLVIN